MAGGEGLLQLLQQMAPVRNPSRGGMKQSFSPGHEHLSKKRFNTIRERFSIQVIH